MNRDDSFVLIFVLFPSKEQADEVLMHLLGQGLVTGGTLLRGLSSFLAPGGIRKEKTYPLSLFTTSLNQQGVKMFIEGHCPKTPFMMFVPATTNISYASWLREEQSSTVPS